MGSHLADALVMAGHEVPSFINSNKKLVYTPGGTGGLPIMAFMGRLCLKGVPF